MDPENIGKEKFGSVVRDGGKDAEVVNGTIVPILKMAWVKAVFYGTSIAWVVWLLGLERFCLRFDVMDIEGVHFC